MTENKEREYISLEALLKKSDTNPVNKKFFELLEESATEEEFTEEWNLFADKQKDTERCLDFSNFEFDINDQKIKDTFKFFVTKSWWDFFDITFCNADFSGSTFKGDAYFWKSTFKGVAYFDGSTFKGVAYFDGSTFKGDANFRGSTFKGDANFERSSFGGNTYFGRSDFGGDANFQSLDLEISYSNILKKDQKEILEKIKKLSLVSCSFNKRFLFSLLPNDNEKICSKTILDIDTTSFTEYTYFNLTKLEKLPNIYKSHISNLQNLRIDDDKERGLKELSKNNDKNNLQFFRKFYKEKLDHHKYLNFSSAELEKKIRENKISYDNIIIWFYKIFSGYGRSIKRPIIVWLIFNFIPLIFRVICNNCKNENLISYQIFIKSIFPVYFPKSLDNIEIATMIFMWFQTPINLILLFLIGLGIKNRINIK